MSHKEIYMLKDTKTYRKGLIASIPEKEAEQVVNNGEGKEVNFPSLDKYKKKIDEAVEQRGNKLKQIEEDYRLSPEGKRENKEQINSEYEGIIGGYRKEYSLELKRLKFESEMDIKKKSTLPSSANQVPQSEIDFRVGTFLMQLNKDKNVVESLETLEANLSTMPEEVAKGLLAKYTDIKSELEGKEDPKEPQKRYSKNINIRKFFDKLQEKVEGEKESEAKLNYEILNQIENRGDYTPASELGREMFHRVKKSRR